ncbi:MAG: CHAT domain-containing protein [Bradymonadia bacterium]
MLFSVALLSCDSERTSAPPAPSRALPAHLAGARTLVKRGVAYLPIYDAQRTPRIRLDGQLSTGPISVSVWFMGPNGEREAGALKEIQLGEYRWIFTEGVPESWEGDGWIEASQREHQARRWPVIWAHAPSQVPELKPIIALRRAGKFAEAESLLNDSRDRLSGLDRMWAEVELGRIHFQNQDFEAAIKSWKTAADTALQVGAVSEAIQRCIALVHLYSTTGQMGLAKAQLDRALDIYDHHEAGLASSGALAAIQYQAGVLARFDGDIISAGEKTLESIRIASMSGMFRYFLSSNYSMSKINSMIGESWGAIDGYSSIIESSLGFLSPVEQMTVYRTRGYEYFQAAVAHQSSSLFDLSVEDYNAALNIAMKHGFDSAYSLMLTESSSIRLATGDLLSIEQIIDQIHDDKTTLDDRLFSILTLSMIMRDFGHEEASTALLFQLVNASQNGPDGLNTYYNFIAKSTISEINQGLSRPEETLALLNEAWAHLNDSARKADFSHSKSLIYSNQSRFIHHFADQLISSDHLKEAISLYDLSSNRIISHLAVNKANTPSNALLEQETASNDLMSADALKRRRRAESDRIDKLLSSLDKQYAEAGQRGVDRTLASYFDHHVSSLEEGEAIIFFKPDGRDWETYYIDKTQVKYAPTLAALSAQVTEGAARHHFFVPNRKHEAFRGHLVFPEHSISLLPSISTLSNLDDVKFTGQPVIVMDPNQDLPFARREGHWLSDHLKALKVEHHLMDHQTAKGEIARSLGRTTLFHFAGHGALLSRQPWKINLKLSGEEKLTLAELISIQPRARLAVLSGCRTGAQGELSQHESIGLPEVFLASGTRTVVSTSRDVDDRLSSEFTRLFYGHGGLSEPGKAFRKAISTLARKDPEVRSVFQIWGRP